jgi:arylsulfatase A-like enzyme
MKAVFVLFDSLCRNALGCYGSRWVRTPHFDRFAQRAVTFDRHFVGSLPCMPARRDLHTGRLNFMHRSWGPLEPFDNSFAQSMWEAGIHAHLVSDHLHYFEDGGATYHTRFRTWDFIRGNEYDPWKAMVQPPVERLRAKYAAKHYNFDSSWRRPKHRYDGSWKRIQHAINSEFMIDEQDLPLARCFASAFEFLDVNRTADPWFLMLECFDPHDLWRDTALVLSTDHGFLLAEHDWWGKNLQPYYTEISHIPMIVHHPDFASRAGTRRDAVTQTMDLMPTFLDFFELAQPSEVRARSVVPLLDADAKHRDIGIFGMFGGPIGATDGRYTYYLYPQDLYAPGLHEYTLMPMHLSSLFSESEMKTAVLAKPFDFTKGMPVMKIDALMDARRIPMHDDKKFDPDVGTTLYDLATDPTQSKPFRDAAIERRFHAGITRELRAHDAPVELYARYQIDTQTAEAATTEEETL